MIDISRWAGGLALVLALGGCLGGGKLSGDPTAAGLADRSGDAVDGLIVGHRLLQAGEAEMALKAYYRAASEQGINADVLSAIGSANLKLGRLGQAQQMLTRALEHDAAFVPALNNLGVVLMEKGEAAEAARVFQQAFALDSGKSDAIRENLRLALATRDQATYDEPVEASDFALVRRGQGEYLLLTR